MNAFNRMVVTLLAALLALAGGLVLLALSGWLPPETMVPSRDLAWLAGSVRELPAARYYATAAGALGSLVLGTGLLVLELRGGRRGEHLLIQRDKLGCVTVSLAGLRRLAEHVVGEVPGVDGVASEARCTREGAVAFRCRVAVKPDASTPQVSDEIRARLGEAVHNHIGQPAGRTLIDVHTQVGALANGRRRVR